MPYAPFYEKFPDIAKKETRTLTVFDMPGLPPGEYGFTEAYCDEPGCDCRRVFFNVVDWQTGQVKAVIAYGWESKAFYAEWFGDDNPTVMNELQGPILNITSAQSPLASALLEQMSLILADRNYVERPKRHYKMFKAAIDQAASKPIGTLKAPRKRLRWKKRRM